MTIRETRKPNEVREIKIEKDIIKHAEGSLMISFGATKVICVASVENKVPPFMRGEGKGWITAEYSMLPRATESRNIREAARGRVSGRTNEIQRMIGRSLRSVIDLEALGERTIWIDCDVIQADGGTRTAAISGGYLALIQALKGLEQEEKIKKIAVKNYLGAVSVGILDGEVLLDLDFNEDYNAEADMNVAMTDEKGFVEIQGTGESFPFSKDQANKMMSYAEEGIEKIIEIQREFVDNEL